MARKNPSTLTWLLIAGGLGVGAFLFWRSRKKAPSVPAVMTAPGPSLPAPAGPSSPAPSSTALPIQIMTAKIGAHEWVTRADGTGFWRRRSA